MPYQTKKLSIVCKLITDGSHFSPKTIENGYPYITVRDINENGEINLIGSKKISSEDFYELSKANCAPKLRDILLSKDGTVGKVAIVKSEGFVVLSSLAILRPGENLDYRYLFYFLNSSEFKKKAIACKTGAAIKRIVLKTIKDFSIPLPPLSTQQKIVEKLDSAFANINSQIELLKKNISGIEELNKSVLEEVFIEEKNKNILFSNKEYLEIIDGDRGLNYPKKSDFKENGYCLFLNTSNVRKGNFDFTKMDFITKEKYEKMGKGKVLKNDVILTTRGTIGNSAFVDDSFQYNYVRINSGMVILRCNLKKIQPKFLIHFINSPIFEAQRNKFTSGSAQPQLPIGVMKNISLPLPPLEKQKEIVTYLDQVFVKNKELKTRHEKQIQTLQEMKQSLLKDAFEGRLV